MRTLGKIFLMVLLAACRIPVDVELDACAAERLERELRCEEKREVCTYRFCEADRAWCMGVAANVEATCRGLPSPSEDARAWHRLAACLSCVEGDPAGEQFCFEGGSVDGLTKG